MLYLYTIAEICIFVESPFPIKIEEDSEDFLKPVDIKELKKLGDSQVYVTFSPVDKIIVTEDNGIRVESRYEVKKGEYEKIYVYSYGDSPYACLENKNNKIICRYIEKYVHMLNCSRKLFNILGMESIFLLNKTFILHSSFICWKGKGILFSAPSGYGKSTQASLWQEYEKAEILNGDRAALRMKGDEWHAYGMPYAGTSGIYRNESAPVKIVFVIRKAEKNSIRKLPLPEALRYLYPEVTVHRWDKEFVNTIMDYLICFATQIPIYMLECLPEKSAVELAKTVLESQKEDEEWK